MEYTGEYDMIWCNWIEFGHGKWWYIRWLGDWTTKRGDVTKQYRGITVDDGETLEIALQGGAKKVSDSSEDVGANRSNFIWFMEL